MSRSIKYFALVIAMGVVGLHGCSAGPDPWQDRPGPKVLAYFPPLYSFAASVAGDNAQVQSLITHIGPHHYDPTTRDARRLEKADIFFTVGLGLDNAIANKLANSSGSKKMHLRPLGELLPKETLREGGCECCKNKGHDANHKHDHGDYDPHVWLGIPEAIRMIEGVRDELVKADPAHAADYQQRAAATIERLNKLVVDGKAQLATKSEKPKVITFHDSLFYFARTFGIEILDSIEAPGQEPSPKKLTKIVEACRANGVRLIAVEPQYPSHTSARVILEELKRHGIDAAFVEIDPLETADLKDLTADFYERKMRRNIDNLTAALK